MQWWPPFRSAKIAHLPLFLENVYANTAMSCQGFRSEPRTPSSMARTRTAGKGLDALWENAIIPTAHGPIYNINQYVYTHLKLNIAPEKLPSFSSAQLGGCANKTCKGNTHTSPWHFRQQCGHAEVPCDAPSCRCNIFSVACQASQTLGDMARVHLSQTLLHTSIIIIGFWLNHKGWMYYMQHVHTCTEYVHPVFIHITYSSYPPSRKWPMNVCVHHQGFPCFLCPPPPWKTNPSFAPPQQRRF